MKHLFVCLSITFFLLACRSGRIIPESVMVKILTEMYIADAVLEAKTLELRNTKDSTYAYGIITSKYGYTVDDLNRSLVKYMKTLKLEKLYAETNESLEEMKQQYEKAARIEEISVNQWKGGRIIRIDIDTNFIKKNFEITLKEKGVYKISFEAKFFADDSTQNPSFYVSLSSRDSAGFQRRIFMSKDTLFTSCCTELLFDDDKYSGLKGHWLDFDTVNVKRLKIKKRNNKTKDSIVGKQHVELKNMSIMYDFEASEKAGFKIEDSEPVKQNEDVKILPTIRIKRPNAAEIN